MSVPLNRRAFIGWAMAGAAAGTRSIPAVEPVGRTGPARMRLSLAAYSFRSLLPNYRGGKDPGETPLDMAGWVELCAGYDVDGVEPTSYFLPDPCPDGQIYGLKRRCHELGLDITGGAIGNNFALEDGPELERQFAYTERWIRTYAALGAPVIRVFAGQPKGTPEQRRGAVERIVRNLDRAGEIAGAHGIMLGIENHDFMTDIDRYLEVLRAVRSPWIGANLDTGNLARTPDPYAEIARMAPYAINVQVKVQIPVDAKREPADYARIAAILRRAGYRGYLVLEYEDKEDPRTAVPRHLAALRAVL